MAEVADRSISVLNRALDNVLDGDLTARVDLGSISKEYYEIGGKINELVDVTSKSIGELKAEKEYIFEIFATMPDPLYIVDLDGIRIDCNPAMEEITGITREELIGKPAKIVFVEEEQAECERALEEVLKTGHATHLPRTILTKSGEKIPVSAHVHARRDSDGNPIGAIVALRDISELKKREEEVEESRKRYHDLVESANNIILKTDTKGTLTFINRFAEEFFGYTREEAIERNIVGTFVPEIESTGRDLRKMILDLYRNTEKYKTNVNENIRRNGERVWVSWTNEAILDKQACTVEIMSIGNDITERKKMKNELEAKNAEMERFVYTVSHDLRSPLITISGFAGMLKRDIENKKREDIETDLDQIKDGIEKMDHLLKDTLELSRIGRITNLPEDVSFKDIVKDALDQMAGEISSNEKNIEISLEDSISKKDKIVHVDRERIVEVLTNLIGNAIRYMGDQPELKIEIGYKSDENVFFVRDNGIGIPPDQHEKVFQLFYKRDKNSEGSGAGLAIVKRIVEVHGGRIWIESEGKKGEGSTFCFTLSEPE
ncbi:MAG: sensory histidine kinase AtoS [Candidatus Methanolliviera sp. GoM_oil]|nr:MAG: sensory histidine kinase AtoS [Candidatus Methanolliviera sp. GoM_oil]